MRPPRHEPLQLGERLQQKPRCRWSLIVKVAASLGSVILSVLLFGGDLLDAYLNFEQLKKQRASEGPLYDLPVSKGRSLSTLGSLPLKNEESTDDLRQFKRLRDTGDPEDLVTAFIFLDRAWQNEEPTASDESSSQFRTMEGDLFIRQGKLEEAIRVLKNACELNSWNWEAQFLLLRAYKAQHYRLQTSPPWPVDRQRQIHDLSIKIKELEEKLRPDLQSRLEDLLQGSSVIELAAGAYSPSPPTGRDIVATSTLEGLAQRLGFDSYCNGGDALMPCLAGRALLIPDGGGKIACNTSGTFNASGGHRAARGIDAIPFGDGCDYFPHGTGGTFNLTAIVPGYNIARSHGDCTNCNNAVLSRSSTTGFERNQAVLAIGVNGGANAGFDRLRHATRDAQRVATSLRELDFRSTVLINNDATRPKILAELAHVVQTSRPDDVFVFYFSGHGFTDVNGHPVLVTGASETGSAHNFANTFPVYNAFVTGSRRANTDTATAVPVETLSLEEVVEVLSYHRGRAVIILDNCLTDMPFDADTPQRTAAGPNRPTIILAGDPGGRVIESPRLGSGLFTYTLLRFLDQQGTPELDFNAMFRYTSAETARLARDLYGVSQRPQWLPVR